MIFRPLHIRQAQFVVAAFLAGFLLIGAGLGFLVGWQNAWSALQNVSLLAVGGLLAASVINSVCRGVRWLVWSKCLGLSVPLGRQAVYYTAGFAFAPTPGKVGTIIRSWFLKKHYKIPYNRTLPMVAMEQVNDFVAVLLILLLCLGQTAGHGWFVAYCLLVVAGLAMAFFWPPFLVFVVKGLYALCGRRGKRFFAMLLKMVRTTRVLFHPFVFGFGVVMGVVGWGAVAVAVWAFFVQAGVNVGLQAGVFAVNFSVVVGALSMVPGGLGGTEATLFGFLSLWGTNAAAAVALIAVMRLATLWFGVLLGFCALPFALKKP